MQPSPHQVMVLSHARVLVLFSRLWGSRPTCPALLPSPGQAPDTRDCLSQWTIMFMPNLQLQFDGAHVSNLPRLLSVARLGPMGEAVPQGGGGGAIDRHPFRSIPTRGNSGRRFGMTTQSRG